MSDRWEQFASGDTPDKYEAFSVNNTEDGSNIEKIGNAAIAGGAAAIGGLGYGAARYLTAPARATAPVINELKQIQGKFGLEGTLVDDLPSLLQKKIHQADTSYSLDRNLMNQRVIGSKQAISAKMDDFNSSILSKSIDDVATSIQSGFDDFVNSAYKRYGDGLASIEASLAKKNAQFNTTQFIDDVLTPAIDNALKSGALQDDIQILGKLKATISKGGKSVVGLEQLKGNVASLSEKLPQNARHKLQEAWGSFLEKNAPSEERVLLKSLNDEYKPFAQSRNAIQKTFDKKTGMFDRAKMTKWIKDYAMGKADASRKELLSFLKSGSAGTQPIKGLSSALETLEKASVKSKAYTKALRKIASVDISTKTTAGVNALKAKNEYLKWASKAAELVSKKEAIMSKYPIRGRLPFLASNLAQRAAGVAMGGVRMMSVYPFISLMIRGLSDPAQLKAGILGEVIPEKGTVDRAVLEEFINKEPLPSTIDLSPQEKFKILYKYGFGA